MLANVYYKHVDGANISTSRYKKFDSDEMFVTFIPEGSETIPFPDGENCIPFSKFVEWMEERSTMETSLNTLGIETKEAEENAE